MNRLLTSALAVALSVAPVTGALARDFSELVIFSGALSDTGNWAAKHGDRPAPFYRNRTSNGPIGVDYLAEWLGLSAEPSLHLIGKNEGTNYAVADALAGGHGPHDLPAEIDAYFKRTGGKVTDNALIFLFIGGNDVVLAVQKMDDAESNKIIVDAVDGIETAIRRLVRAGARTIVAPDFINVGYAPLVTQFGPQAVERSARLSHEYNKKFLAMLDKVEKELDFELVRWSFDDFVKDLITRGSGEMKLNTTEACIDVRPQGRCDYDKFVFLTGEYPTSKVHRLFGTAAALAILQRPDPRQMTKR